MKIILIGVLIWSLLVYMLCKLAQKTMYNKIPSECNRGCEKQK